MPDRNYGYRKLSDEELAAILKELPGGRCWPARRGSGSRWRAPGQSRGPLEGGAVCLPLGGAPSTHILKPAVERFEGVVFNEALCMRLAAAAGLPAATIETQKRRRHRLSAGGTLRPHHRRVPDGAPVLERLHQEDFCQALGIVSEQKYQKEGGPSLKQCFALLREVSSGP